MNDYTENYIELADGTRFLGLASEIFGYLLITVSAEDAREHLLDFMDIKKTKKIVFVINKKDKREYEGYVHFAYAEQNSMNPVQIVVWLRKDESEA